MKDFFSSEVGQSIEFFGLTHILLILSLIASMVLLWYYSPKIRDSKYEKFFRFGIVALVFLFEWQVFESRLLNGSIFRMPLCAVALYGLTFAVSFKNEKAFKILYFYAFGAFLTYIVYDTPWGMDRWGGWKFFGAHAMITWLAVYGYNVFGFKPKKQDLLYSMLFLGIYSIISAYATYNYGGSDELFMLTPPLAELSVLVDVHQLLYTLLFMLFAAILMYLMYLPTKITIRKQDS